MTVPLLLIFAVEHELARVLQGTAAHRAVGLLADHPDAFHAVDASVQGELSCRAQLAVFGVLIQCGHRITLCLEVRRQNCALVQAALLLRWQLVRGLARLARLFL